MKECTFRPKITLFKSKSALKERKISTGSITRANINFLSRNPQLLYSKSANLATPKSPVPVLDLKSLG